MTRQYKAFISYSWHDRNWGDWLHRALEGYRTPAALIGKVTPLGPVPARLQPIFRDRKDEAAGSSIDASIEAALGASEFLIVLCSPHAARSAWVNHEIAWFKTHRDPRRILAIIIDGEPGASFSADGNGEECFPKTLLHEVDADLRQTTHRESLPLAADARKSGDGKRGAKFKIAAAMLGVELDELLRRDDRRRAVRRRFLVAALATLSLVLATLSLFALHQRDAARSAQKEAEFQRDEAQSLVEFMLTDLRQRLDAVGRLDILETVAARLQETYARQDLSKLDADAIGRRARVLLLLGEVETARGQLDNALARYQEASAATEELLRRDPDNPKRIFDHAQSVYWVGDIAWKRGDVALATDRWTRYRDYGARLVSLEPGNEEWQTELGYGHRNLGAIAYEEGTARDAADAFTRARDISREIARMHRDSDSLQIVYADDQIWLAMALEKQGALQAAEAELATEAEISDALLVKDPANDAVLQRRSVNRRMTARLEIEQGDGKRAVTLLEEQVRLINARLLSDRDNTAWLDFLALLQIDLADAQLAMENIKAARVAADSALLSARQLVALDPTVIDWKLTDLGGALHAAARIAVAEHDYRAAWRLLDETEFADTVPTGKAGRNFVLQQFAMGSTAVRALILESSGKHVDAQRMAEQGVRDHQSIVVRLAPTGLHTYYELCVLAGDDAMANSVANTLDSFGYRHPDYLRLRDILAARQRGASTNPQGKTDPAQPLNSNVENVP